jgi:lipopolysaccharide biosynthesis glycosyltransferase
MNLHVVYCLDHRYLRPCIASVRSLMTMWPLAERHWREGVTVHFVVEQDADGLLRRQLLAEERRPFVFRVHVVGADDAPYRAAAPYISRATQLRLRLPEVLLGEEVRRVLYLDCDTLVAGDLGELEAVEPAWGVAAVDMQHNLMTSPEWSAGEPYAGATSFNAGVMLLDLVELRELGFPAFRDDLLRRSALNDQSVLNLFCQGRHRPLPQAYNHFPRGESPRAPADARVLHWCSSQKPWSGDCPLANLWHAFDRLESAAVVASRPALCRINSQPAAVAADATTTTGAAAALDVAGLRLSPAAFDAEQYAFYNWDLRAAGDASLRWHYVQHGRAEGRRHADPHFDAALFGAPYRAYLQDVRGARKNAHFDGVLERFRELASGQRGLVALVDHDAGCAGATAYVCLLAAEAEGRCVLLTPGNARQKAALFGLDPARAHDYDDDPTLLCGMLEALAPARVVFNSSSVPLCTVLPLFPESVLHSHEIKEHYLPWRLKVRRPDFVVAAAIARDYDGEALPGPRPGVLPPILTARARARIDAKARDQLCATRYRSLLRLKALGGRPVVAMCGGLDARKNPAVFRAAAALAPELHFLWIGGAQKDAEAQLLDPALPNLSHVPATENPHWIFRNVADVFALTSLADPCPYVVLEALFLGLPCAVFEDAIFTRHPERPGMYFVSPGVPRADALVAAARALLAQPPTAAARAEARDYILENYGQVPPYLSAK